MANCQLLNQFVKVVKELTIFEDRRLIAKVRQAINH